MTQGECPNCGSQEVTYGDSTLEGESVGYEFTCDKCGKEFVEWYNLTYVETVEK
jgi:predicted RNA-binding Zn-ribbon protein involved in translation (DUF1610 family)